jgi:hypothetical protein
MSQRREQHRPPECNPCSRSRRARREASRVLIADVREENLLTTEHRNPLASAALVER